MRGLVRGWACAVVLAGWSGCRQPNPDWLGPAAEQPSSGPVASDDAGASSDTGASSSTGAPPASETGSSTSGDASTSGTTGSTPSQCEPEVVPGQGACPASCTSCDGGRCLVDCGVLDCQSGEVTCPAGWPCDIACTGDGACKRSDLTCPLDRDCAVTCQGFEACQMATITCGVGSCPVTCSADGNSCHMLDLACGAADSTITCAAPMMADVQPLPGSSCACETIGCA